MRQPCPWGVEVIYAAGGTFVHGGLFVHDARPVARVSTGGQRDGRALGFRRQRRVQTPGYLIGAPMLVLQWPKRHSPSDLPAYSPQVAR
jgi:hypothetical protein